METQEKESCLIEKTKRTRVRGPGPRRNEMVTFAKIGDVDTAILDQLRIILLQNPQNDLGGDDYNISQQCDLKDVFNAAGSYRQVLLQKSKYDSPTANEFDYTEFNVSSKTLKTAKKYVHDFVNNSLKDENYETKMIEINDIINDLEVLVNGSE